MSFVQTIKNTLFSYTPCFLYLRTDNLQKCFLHLSSMNMPYLMCLRQTNLPSFLMCSMSDFIPNKICNKK